jgi:hypothetical protein
MRPPSRTESSCRSTTISSSLNSSERRRSDTSWSRQRHQIGERPEQEPAPRNQRDRPTTLRPTRTSLAANRVNAPSGEPDAEGFAS